MPMPVWPTVSVSEWRSEGERRFGTDLLKWKFQCPVCGHVQTPADFRKIGADPEDSYQQCIGRKRKDCARDFARVPAKDGGLHPCDYAAYGLFQLGNFVSLDDGKLICVFPFAEVR